MAISKILSDLLEQDKFAKFTRTGNTTATLGALTLSTTTLGAGGLDTGTIAASTFYYVYTVVTNSAVIRLVASTSATSPVGFAEYKKVGAFYTDSSSNIFKAYYFGEVNLTVLSFKASDAGVIISQNFNFISGSASISTVGAEYRYTYNFLPNIFSITPAGVTTPIYPVASSNAQGNNTISSLSTTQILVGCTRQDGSSEATTPMPHEVICQKQGVDAIMPDWSRI